MGSMQTGRKKYQLPYCCTTRLIEERHLGRLEAGGKDVTVLVWVAEADICMATCADTWGWKAKAVDSHANPCSEKGQQ